MKRITFQLDDESVARVKKIAQENGYKLSFAYLVIFMTGLNRAEKLDNIINTYKPKS